MKPPRLVQRCLVNTRKSSEIVGIDSYLGYAYMGSAEFEFGQLGSNLKCILPFLKEYSVVKTDFKCATGEGIFLLCTKEQEMQAKEWLALEVAKKNKNLQEATYFAENLQRTKDQTSHFDLVDVWWVLEDSFGGRKIDHQNIWFFCKGKQTAELLRSALERTKLKK